MSNLYQFRQNAAVGGDDPYTTVKALTEINRQLHLSNARLHDQVSRLFAVVAGMVQASNGDLRVARTAVEQVPPGAHVAIDTLEEGLKVTFVQVATNAAPDHKN